MLSRAAVAALALCLAIGPAAAQPTPPSARATATPDAADPSPAELQGLIRTLEDPAARQELLARLKALSAATPPADDEGALDEVMAAVNDAIDVRMETAGQAVVGVAGSLREVPILLRWLWLQLSDPISRALWWSVLAQTGAAVFAGFLASLLLRFALRGWRDRLCALPLAARTRAKVRASLAHLTVDLAALGLFLAVTYAVLAFGAITALTQAVARDVLVAIGCVRGLTAFSRAFLAPENPRRRVPRLDDGMARGLQRWILILLGLGFYGHFGLNAAERLGMPWTVRGFLSHVLFLIVTILAIVQIYRLRGAVAALVEHWGHTSTSAFTRYLPWRWLAANGPHILSAWAALVFLVWALDVPDGALLLTRGFLVTLLALLAVRAFHIWLDRKLLPRPAAPVEEGVEPEAEPRPASRVVLATALHVAAILAALVTVLEAWGLDVSEWLGTSAGRAMLVSLGRIGIVIAVVAAIAKAVQVISARYIHAADAEGRPVYSNRTRTLVSMARNVALALLAAVAVIEVLAEIGVNANALLAGAGVVGLALGFGSQKLVQDLITGMFILLGDTVRVGDVVDVSGKAGVVEAISMRTITLRDYNGNVHTIPYSSIDVVTNMTKDFSFAVFDVAVAYKEDVDQVMETLRQIDAQLRREWPYRRLILEPLEIAGVDAFRESSVLIKARSKVRAGEQWKVGREFNRRLKLRFDELGIEIPFPHRTIYFANERGADAPPAQIEELRRQLLAEEPAPKRAVGES